MRLCVLLAIRLYKCITVQSSRCPRRAGGARVRVAVDQRGQSEDHPRSRTPRSAGRAAWGSGPRSARRSSTSPRSKLESSESVAAIESKDETKGRPKRCILTHDFNFFFSARVAVGSRFAHSHAEGGRRTRHTPHQATIIVKIFPVNTT